MDRDLLTHDRSDRNRARSPRGMASTPVHSCEPRECPWTRPP
ncbi:hypothetical protein NSERUTF1_5658 [Nocardia seriolae]|nr:hypothetical protein NSERUTF1_5658 [Nocardia seriolae]